MTEDLPTSEESGTADPAPSWPEAPDFYGDSFSMFSQKSGGSLYQPNDGSMRYVPGPDGTGWIEFATGKTTGISISGNPRDEMIGPAFGKGQAYWQGGAFWLPEPWPTFPSGLWMNLMQITPGSGSPAVSIEQFDHKLVWNRNSGGNIWTKQLADLTGRKVTFLVHVQLPASSGGNGTVSMWLDGERMADEVAVAISVPSDGVHPYIQQYRHKSLPR